MLCADAHAWGVESCFTAIVASKSRAELDVSSGKGAWEEGGPSSYPGPHGAIQDVLNARGFPDNG